MAKVVPILGIVCAVVAALFAGNITPSPALPIIALLLCIAVAVVAFLSRTPLGLGAGIVILVLGVLTLAWFTPIQGDGKDIVPNLSELGIKLLSISLLAAVAWILVANRNTLQPTWMPYVGFGLLALAVVLVLVQPGSEFGTFTPVGMLAGLACLLLVWPMVVLLRGDTDTRTETVAPVASPSSKAVRK